MKTCAIVAYQGDASLVCLPCTFDVCRHVMGIEERNLEESLDIFAWKAGINRNDESSYDSSEFYKVVILANLDSDSSCGNCLERITDTL